MKKITLLAFSLALSTFAFSQSNSISELGNNNPIFVGNQNIERAPCDQGNDSNAFENGKSFTQNLGRIVAHDLTVDADGTFILETVSLNAFIGPTGSGVNASFVDVYIYDDASGVPGNLITTELGLIPTNQTVNGNNFGFENWLVEIDITDVTLNSVGGAATTYWIGVSLEATDASNAFWENSTAGAVGLGEAYDDGVLGFVIDNTLEGVYTFVGQCNPLGVNENIANLVSVYPNPTTDILNVKVPANVTITGATLVNVLGANTGLRLVNGSINTSTLASGVYILTVNTSAGTLTQKVVKQ